MGRNGAGRRGLTGAAVLLSTLLTLGLIAGPAGASSPLRGDVFKATNRSRVSRDVHRLRLNAALSLKAKRHSAAMADAGYLFHTTAPDRYYLRGVRWSYWGENVGSTTGSISELQKAFMHSKVHRANILDRDYEKVAVGAIRRGGTTWVTVFFYG